MRSVGIYGYSMRDGEPLGHLILSKLRLQRRGQYYPAISIESIVSQNKKKRCTAMVEFAKVLMRETAEQGFLRAVPPGRLVGEAARHHECVRAVVLKCPWPNSTSWRGKCIIRGNWVDRTVLAAGQEEEEEEEASND